VSEETRYFISSLDANDPQRLERVVRAHWAIENNLHWVLDIAFDEDSNRTRKGHSAANFAVIRHIALNLIKAEKTAKVGIKIKRLKAGWDNNYGSIWIPRSFC
jgi:predicted transposase YbfD/YdcC